MHFRRVSLASLAFTVWCGVASAAPADIQRLRCSYESPSKAPADPVALEFAKFWRNEPLSRPLYLVIQTSTGKVSLDPELVALAKQAEVGASQMAVSPEEALAFTIDMRWLGDLRTKFEVARFSISIDRYSLESDAIIELVKPGQKPELYKTAWIRRGKCTLRAL